jgi:hypothetical protein
VRNRDCFLEQEGAEATEETQSRDFSVPSVASCSIIGGGEEVPMKTIKPVGGVGSVLTYQVSPGKQCGGALEPMETV